MVHPIVLSARNQIGGQSATGDRVAKQDHLTVEEVCNAGHGRLEGVHHKGDVTSIEVSSVEDEAFLGVNQRVVIHAVDLHLQNAAKRKKGIDQHTDDVGGAPDRI